MDLRNQLHTVLPIRGILAPIGMISCIPICTNGTTKGILSASRINLLRLKHVSVFILFMTQLKNNDTGVKLTINHEEMQMKKTGTKTHTRLHGKLIWLLFSHWAKLTKLFLAHFTQHKKTGLMCIQDLSVCTILKHQCQWFLSEKETSLFGLSFEGGFEKWE